MEMKKKQIVRAKLKKKLTYLIDDLKFIISVLLIFFQTIHTCQRF